MAYKKKFVAGVVLGFVLSVPALAAQDAPLNASERTAVLKTLAESMKAKYIEPAVAERVAQALRLPSTNIVGGDWCAPHRPVLFG